MVLWVNVTVFEFVMHLIVIIIVEVHELVMRFVVIIIVVIILVNLDGNNHIGEFVESDQHLTGRKDSRDLGRFSGWLESRLGSGNGRLRWQLDSTHDAGLGLVLDIPKDEQGVNVVGREKVAI